MRWVIGGILTIVGVLALLAAGSYFALRRGDLPYETLATEYATPSSRYADLPGGIHMHYRDEGQRPPAHTLLLIHGFSASLQTWEPWVQRLGNEYRLVSLDLPGHGLTQSPAGYQASIEALRDAVFAFTEQQQLSRFTIVGSSMGGNVAWEYALAHPEQVEALVLVDASGWPETRAGLDQDPPIFKLLRNPVLGPLLRDLDNTRLIRQGLEAAFYDPTLVDDVMVRRYTQLARAPGHRDILLQMTLGFRERHYATPERLAALRMPVLILSGDTDRLVPVEHARQFNSAIAGSQLVVFEQTGHVPQEERPDESAAATREFLARVYSGATPTATAQ